MDNKFSSKEVMVIEDNEHDFQLIKRILNKQGVTKITHCIGAEQSLEKLKDSAQIDLIILDLDLSKTGKNGLDVLHEIKSSKKLKSIKVVVISGNIELLDYCGQADLVFRKHKFTELMRYTIEAVGLLK